MQAQSGSGAAACPGRSDHAEFPNPNAEGITIERYLTRDTLLIVAANLLPIAGIVYLGWSGFLLLVLYWLETAAIGFWACYRVATAPAVELEMFKDQTGRPMSTGIGLAAFIAVHAGIFMGVHMGFLWGLFRDGAFGDVTGPLSFFDIVVIGTGIWAPLLGLFIVRGVATIDDARAGRPVEPAVIGLYVRVFIMQITILVSGWLLILMGGTAGIVVLVLIKTAFDLMSDRVGQYIEQAMHRAKAERSGGAK